MFRKVQLKFFATIICILVAIFIAVLGSINLIMDAIMEKQSKFVLKQVAQNVEYDENSPNNFTFTRPDEDKRPWWAPFDNGRNDNSQPAGGNNPPATTAPPATTEQPADTTATASSTTAAVSATDAAVSTAEAETEAQFHEPPPPEEEQPEPENEEHDEPEPYEPAPEGTAAPDPTVAETQPPSPPKTEKAAENETEENDDNDNDDDDNDDSDDDDDDDEQPTTERPYDPWSGWQPPTERDRRDRDGDRRWGFDPWFGEYPEIRENAEQEDDDAADDYICPPIMFGMAQTASPAFEGGIVQLVETYAQTETSAPATTTEPSVPPQNIPPDKPPEEQQRQYMEGRENVPKSLGSIDFFIIMADPEGNYIASLNNDDLDEETAQNYVTAILDKGLDGGMLMDQYQFVTEPKSNGTLMVFTDKSAEMDMMNKLRRTTIIIGLASILLISIASYFLSGLIVKPIQIAFDKQKQFISDASHELKTPLAVISTNADVLSGEIGENKWLTYIQDQTGRMNILVNDLLNLTRLENNTTQIVYSEFDLSQAIESTALPFECRAFEEEKEFIIDIEEGLRLTASEQHVKQMAAIFIDNALKYSHAGGKVKVSLVRDGDKKVLSVFNTGDGVKTGEEEKIFERFYRSDESRNRATGGYGLGLAIARSIIDKHHFKINVENREGESICFVVIM